MGITGSATSDDGFGKVKSNKGVEGNQQMRREQGYGRGVVLELSVRWIGREKIGLMRLRGL